jgi:acetyl-CoA synthetase
MDSEDILFILYTSGSTGKPKGVVHTCGGYMVYTAYSFANVFQYQPGDVHFCTADIGWITGHSYILYGPLAAGATSLMFEGTPTWPDAGRFWGIVQKHKVNILYTAPTAIRSLMGFGTEPVVGKDLSSLKVLGVKKISRWFYWRCSALLWVRELSGTQGSFMHKAFFLQNAILNMNRQTLLFL